jgi:hypothetical protein
VAVEAVSMIFAGPIDWDLDSLVPDLLKLLLIFIGAVLLVLVTSAVLLTGATVGLTYLRRRRAPECAAEPGDEECEGR